MSEWPTAEHVPAEKLALRQGVRPAPPSCSMITQLHRTRALADELITQHRGSRAPVGRFHRAGKERTSVVDIDALLPRARTPRHYLDLVADSRIDLEVLHQLARNPYPFVRLAVAKDTRTSAATLAELLSGEFDRWDRNHLLRLIAEHPRADRGVLLGVLHETAALLRQLDARPYAASIALASRRELEPDEVRRLQYLPGASRRMRRGVERALARRPSSRT